MLRTAFLAIVAMGLLTIATGASFSGADDQARKDFKKIRAEKDSHLEWIVQQLSLVSPRWKYAPSHPQKLPAGEDARDD